MNISGSKSLMMLLFCLISCKEINNDTAVFDPGLIVENELTLSEIADEITYIPLDNNFPIGAIYRNICMTSDAIYLSDQSTGILKYDRNGRFVTKIGSVGRGPAEYVHCSEFRLDQQDNVYIRDNSHIKVFSKTGRYLRKFSIGEYEGDVDFFEIFDSKVFIFYFLQREGTIYDWIVIDTLGNLISKKKRSLPDFICEWGEPWLTYEYEKKLYYWNPFTDTVFSISPEFKREAHLIINPGKHRMPRSKIYTFENYEKYLHLKRLFETDRYFLIIYSYKKPAIALIDKRNGNTFMTFLAGDPSGEGLALTGGIENDYDGGLRLLPRCYINTHGREYFAGLLSPVQIKTHFTSQKYKDDSKMDNRKFEILAETIRETDNPILMMVRLKK